MYCLIEKLRKNVTYLQHISSISVPMVYHKHQNLNAPMSFSLNRENLISQALSVLQYLGHPYHLVYGGIVYTESIEASFTPYLQRPTIGCMALANSIDG